MAGMEHIISMEEMIHSRKVERKEVGETSKGHDQPVIVSSIAIHGETGSDRGREFYEIKGGACQRDESMDIKAKDTKGCVCAFDQNIIIVLLK